MKQVTNFPLYNGCLEEYGDMAGAVRCFADAGLDGLEVIWDHMPYTDELPPHDAVVGYHLMFWSNWVDFWRQDRAALLAEFGDEGLIRDYYHGDTPQDMIDRYRVDLQRAIDLEAEYVVFHVSEVSLAECFTYDFRFSDEEVIDAAAELVNRLLDGSGFKGAFLMENQWWPGLRFTDPVLTRRLLERVEYANKGIMLDVGHLLSTNTKLRTQQQAADYVEGLYRDHGALGDYVRGLHLHKSLSGEYVEGTGFRLPDDYRGEYWDRYTRTYQHIVQIDRHEPWDDPVVGRMVRTLDPEWANHELSAWPREPHLQALATQMRALGDA